MDKQIEEYLEIIPTRYHKEFLNDVIVDEQSIKYIRKVTEYYLAEIFDELTSKEKEIIGRKMIIIEL